ncbi:MAG: VWA domain-containing protein [Polyangiaceae bacterium]|nr:VWA domain-containing protein [Polyangiaceae bacterium]
MKVRTVALLAALGMTATSYSVWSFGPRPDGRGSATRAGAGSPGLELAVGDGGAAFRADGALRVEGRLGHERLASGRAASTFALVTVTADARATERTAAPLELAIVLDRSGSMRGAPLERAIAAARGAIDRLRDGDSVSLVTYAGEARVIARSVAVDRWSRSRLLAELDRVQAEGETCISCALDATLGVLRGGDARVSRVLLLSDGEATAGVRDVEGFRRIARRFRERGVPISSIGVDVEYDHLVLGALALESNGRHHFAESAGELPAIFDRELGALVRSVAADAIVELELAPGVELVRVLDRAHELQGRRLRVPIGDLSAGEERTVLVELRLPAAARAREPVARVDVSWVDLARERRDSAFGTLTARRDPGGDDAPLDPVVATRLERSETAAALRDANSLFAAGRTDDARRRLAERQGALAERRERIVAASPAPDRARVREDLERQEGSVGSASGGFARAEGAPGTPPSPAATKAGRAQVRRSAETAVDLAF